MFSSEGGLPWRNIFFTISTNSPVSLPSPSAAVSNLGVFMEELSSILLKLSDRASRSRLGSLVTFVTKSV